MSEFDQSVDESESENQPRSEHSRDPDLDALPVEPAEGDAAEIFDAIELADLKREAESTAAVGPSIPAAAEPETLNSLPFILEAISAIELTLMRRFDGLQEKFEREVRAESTREKVVDRLHSELQEYKNGLLLSILRPVFLDMIQLHDDMGKSVATTAESEETGEKDPRLDLVRDFQQGIEDILYRQGVEPYQLLETDAFDPRRQRSYATVPNDDPERSKRVAKRLRKGFQAGEKVIRPEIVTVYSSPK